MKNNLKFDFFFNEVDIVREDNPKELMDFEMVSSKMLKLKINCIAKKADESSIAIKRRKLPFENKLKWELTNNSDKTVSLDMYLYNSQNYIINHIPGIDINPESLQTFEMKNIPEDTHKIVLLCKKRFNKNVVGDVIIKSVV